MNGININKKMIVFTTTILIPIGNVKILYDNPIPTYMTIAIIIKINTMISAIEFINDLSVSYAPNKLKIAYLLLKSVLVEEIVKEK